MFDKVLHENADLGILPIVVNELGLHIVHTEYRKEKMQATDEREVDGHYWLKTLEGKEIILHMEYQTKNDPNMVLRINRYVAMIRYYYPGIKIKSVVLFVGDNTPTMRTQLTEDEIFRGFDLIMAKDLDHKTLLASEEPAIIVTSILGDYQKENAEEMIYQIIARLKEVCKTNKDLIKSCRQLLVLSILRKLGTLTQKILEKMSIHIDVTKTSLFQEAFMPMKMEFERLLKQERKEKEEARKNEKQARKNEEQAKMEKDAIQRTIVVNLLKNSSYSDLEIAGICKVPLSFVVEIQNKLQ